MNKNYLIAVCDILGFSKLFDDEKNSLDIITDRYVGYLKRSLMHTIYKDFFPDNIPTLEKVRRNSDIGIAWFSDTILLYTKEDTNEQCKTLLQNIGWLIFENMSTPHNATRLRVGISYGEAFIDEKNETFLGKPIVEAYKLENKQKWSGGALTKKAEERFGNYLASLNPVESWVVPYDVPVGDNTTEKLLAINWTNGIHNNTMKDFYWRYDRHEPSQKECIEHPDVIEKWKNTKEFHKNNCRHCFPKLNSKD